LPVDYPIKGGRIFLIGLFSGWQLLKNYELHFNSKTSSYETTLYLKQGYYEYLYYFDANEKEDPFESLLLEGNDYETENTYQVFVYYRPFGSRYDEVIGYRTTDTYNK
jgi:hypothetical protein